MNRRQMKIRLNSDIAFLLEKQAKQQGIPYTTLCERILEDVVAKLAGESRFLMPTNALIAKLDIVASRFRSIQAPVTRRKPNAKIQKYPE
jgi:hypothetical protein